MAKVLVSKRWDKMHDGERAPSRVYLDNNLDKVFL
jgi:hypothetical protein